MAVTELALLSLLPPSTINDQSLREKLASAKYAMETFTHRAFYFFAQIENPAFLYIIGEWEDLEQHYQGYIPSEANRRILESLKDQVSVDWLVHIDTDQKSLPLSAPVLSIGRYFISSGQKEAYSATFEAVSHHLRNYIIPSHVAHGWRLEKEEGDDTEESILILGWDDVASHHAFAQTEGYKDFARLKEFVKDADIKHAERLDV
ncbi:hypothetical protein MMC07_006721 [Pseudocyphellaria aurata]|nr:hypothetical protein [Pseudocyphellaria aurata]